MAAEHGREVSRLRAELESTMTEFRTMRDAKDRAAAEAAVASAARERQWEAEQERLLREHSTAAGREKTKVQEQLVKAADKLRKQLAAAEREKETLAKEAAQRAEDVAAETDAALKEKDERVAELRLAMQVAKTEASEAQDAAAQMQRDLDDAGRTAKAERMALNAVAEEVRDAQRSAEEECRRLLCSSPALSATAR